MGKKKKSNKVKPQLLKGFKDYTPKEQIARERMLSTIRSVFEMRGFLPYRTAALESAETLLGSHYNEDSLAELFGFCGPEEVDMALRYEFTLSLARFVAGNPDLPLPFRGYQYGPVFRVDKPGPGRYREFTQCDIDIVGSANLLADSEIIATMVATLEALGIERFKVRFSSRRILNGLIEFAGIPAETGPDVMRVIDKLEKQGREAVLQELGPGRTDKSGDKIPGLNLGDSQINEIDRLLTIAGTETDNPLAAAEQLLGEMAESVAGIADLRQILSHLSNMRVSSDKFGIDLTIVRGLGYYTGPVFETNLLDLPEYGSIFSGGRYDNLVDRFLNRSIPAVGTSCGLDRLLAALIELERISLRPCTSDVLVTVMDRDKLPEYLRIVAELREAGIATEIFQGDTKNLTKQIKYGDKIGVQFAVIAGSDEFDKGLVTVKNLSAGREMAQQVENREEWLKAEEVQQTIERAQLVEFVLKNRG